MTDYKHGFRADGKVALVTGAARGLGAETARALAQVGAKVLVTDILEGPGRETVEAIRRDGGEADFLRHDVTDEDQWQATVTHVVKALGGLDIVVNNAGMERMAFITDCKVEDFRRLLDVNVTGTFLGLKHCIGAMRPGGAAGKGGSIINISSVAGLVGVTALGAYCASKGAVRLLTKSAAVECAQLRYGIRVNSIHPGVVWTQMGEDLLQHFVDLKLVPDLATAKATFETMTPMGVLGEPPDVVNAVLYLASDATKWVTGTETIMDGGGPGKRYEVHRLTNVWFGRQERRVSVADRPSLTSLPGVRQRFTGLSQDEENILDHADRFAREQLYPLSQRMDDEEWWPEHIFPMIGEMGYFGITAPEAYGGTNLDLMASALIVQAFSRWNHALGLSWVAHENLCLNNILRNANEEQCRRYVPALCSGKSIGALGLTEPGAGSDALGSMRTTARRDGPDYVLNGGKIFITNGPVADVLLVYAKTDRDRGPMGISAFIVEKGTPGFRVAQKLTKMGFRGSPTAELVFEDCRVPAENLVGEENRGVAVVMSGLDLERAMVSPIALGIAERALQISVDYARQRKQFGQPISNFQMIRSKLADMFVWTESIRLFTYQTLRAANELEQGGGGRGEIHKLTAASCMYAAETLSRVLNEAVQIHGGSGYIWETEVNRLYRSIKLLEIGAGTTEVRKIIISDELLRG